MSEWIECENNMPENKLFCNIYINSNDYCGVSSALFLNNKWIDSGCIRCGFSKTIKPEYVTHWKFLPEAPK